MSVIHIKTVFYKNFKLDLAFCVNNGVPWYQINSVIQMLKPNKILDPAMETIVIDRETYITNTGFIWLIKNCTIVQTSEIEELLSWFHTWICPLIVLERQFNSVDNKLNFTSRYVIFDRAIWFVAIDVIRALNYTTNKNSTNQILHRYVNSKHWTPYDKLLIQSPFYRSKFESSLHKHVMITRGGVSELIMNSSKPIARDKQSWILNDVLPNVLITGEYKIQKSVFDESPTIPMDDSIVQYNSEDSSPSKKMKMESLMNGLLMENNMLVKSVDELTAKVEVNTNNVKDILQQTNNNFQELMRQNNENFKVVLQGVNSIVENVVQSSNDNMMRLENKFMAFIESNSKYNQQKDEQYRSAMNDFIASCQSKTDMMSNAERLVQDCTSKYSTISGYIVAPTLNDKIKEIVRLYYDGNVKHIMIFGYQQRTKNYNVVKVERSGAKLLHHIECSNAAMVINELKTFLRRMYPNEVKRTERKLPKLYITNRKLIMNHGFQLDFGLLDKYFETHYEQQRSREQHPVLSEDVPVYFAPIN
jgi:prophage antirepressor-like protein